MGVVLFSVNAIEPSGYGRVGRRTPRNAVLVAAAPVGRAHVDVTAGADDPERSRLPRRRVASDRRNRDLRDCA
jgi:hypothetical protein